MLFVAGEICSPSLLKWGIRGCQAVFDRLELRLCSKEATFPKKPCHAISQSSQNLCRSRSRSPEDGEGVHQQLAQRSLGGSKTSTGDKGSFWALLRVFRGLSLRFSLRLPRTQSLKQQNPRAPHAPNPEHCFTTKRHMAGLGACLSAGFRRAQEGQKKSSLKLNGFKRVVLDVRLSGAVTCGQHTTCLNLYFTFCRLQDGYIRCSAT